jgi:hypothetical protein
MIIHTWFLYDYKIHINRNRKGNNAHKYKFILETYFLQDIIELFKQNISFKFILGIIVFFSLDALVFLNRIKIWVYFNKKNKTLPNSFSKNTTFYITANVVNMENIIESFIEEMKKLINYLGENNIIVSIIENGDSKDNTRKYLNNFHEYLNENKIMNKFYLNKEIEDPRMNYISTLKLTPLRIKYYAKLRNKCLDFLYELKNIDFDNTIVLFFNDIIFNYEDIIYLLSTNNEDYDAVCGLDMVDHIFYDAWVSIDLDGNGLKPRFPYFSNKEGQDLVAYHKPVRIFSCWNGIIAFKASPIKDKKVQFRYKMNSILPKNIINTPIKNYFESECTYFHIDIHSLGYSKKFINPDVRVTYKKDGFFEAKYFIPTPWHILNYFSNYFRNFLKQRNKYMSNYFDNNIKLKPILENWYLENKVDMK